MLTEFPSQFFHVILVLAFRKLQFQELILKQIDSNVYYIPLTFIAEEISIEQAHCNWMFGCGVMLDHVTL